MVRQLFFILIFIANLYSSPINLQITDKINYYDNFELSYLKVPDSNFTINDIHKQSFTKKTSNKFTLGYTKGDVWFKLDIHNNSNNEDFILSLGESFYEVANLYYVEDNKWVHKYNGVFTSINEREVSTNHLSFKLQIPQNQTKTIYLQIQGKYAYFGNINVQEERYFYQHIVLGVNTLYIILLGIILIITVFNTFLYFKTKERIYLYYVGYSFFNYIYVSNLSGLLVFLDLQFLIYKLQFSAAFMIGFLILFSLEFFNTKQYLSKYHRFLLGLSFPSFFLGIMILFQYQPWNKYINNYSALMCIIFLIVAILIYRKGEHKTKYYIFAIGLFFIFVILFTLMIVGLFEYSIITRYGYIVATVIEITIFSLMLSNRYYEMSEDVITSQKKLLSLKEKNELFLENEIQERTRELQLGYEQISNLLGEKDILLKEVHHRVKNNFHMITGLLWMEEQKDNRAKERFQNLRSRIKSMSIIHEKLYKSKDISHITLDEYIEEIITNIFMSHKDRDIFMTHSIEKIELKFEDALSIGFITTEILHNCLKHNPKQKTLNITIVVKVVDNIFTMSIKDDGIGFQNKNAHDSDGVGLKLIESFSKSLSNSSYEFISAHGLEFILTFELLKEDI